MMDESEDVKAISALMTALKPLDEEARVHVLDFVLKRLGISLSATQNDLPDSPSLPAATLPPLTAPHTTVSSGHVDIRSFAQEKEPATVNERVAVIGYYLAHLAPEGERRDYLTSDDIKKYFVQAGFHLPTAPPSVTLAHAKDAGYLNAIGGGQFKLNSVGYNRVAHKLPKDGTEKRKRKGTKAGTKVKKRVKARK